MSKQTEALATRAERIRHVLVNGSTVKTETVVELLENMPDELLRQEALIAELAGALKLISDEMEAGLPRSLGYEFTHIPEARAALAKVQQ